MYADTVDATLDLSRRPNAEEAHDCRLWPYNCRETCQAQRSEQHASCCPRCHLGFLAAADTVAGLGAFTSIFPVFPAIFEVLLLLRQ